MTREEIGRSPLSMDRRQRTPLLVWTLLSALAASAVLAPSCRRHDRPPGVQAPSDSARPGRIRLEIGAASLWVEVVDRPETRQAGLMYRRSLPEDEGMLFVFEEPQILDFWMKNTHIPLDIAFISSDGSILNIEAMKPLDEGPRYRSRSPARYALEVNQGWFASKGIVPGQRIRF